MRFVTRPATLFFAIIAGTISYAHAVMANDQELYDPAPPANAAFVRVINATNNDTLKVTVSGIAYDKVAKGSAAAYQVVKEGEVKPSVVAAGKTVEATAVKVDAGKYYTFAVTGEGSVIAVKEIEDALMANPAKSYVYFYNMSDAAAASLTAPVQKADVVKASAGTAGSRDVNPLTLDLAVMADGKEVKAFPKVSLQRRAGVSFILSGKAGALNAVMLNNEVKRK